MPNDDSWIVRRFEELERRIREAAAGQTLNAASVGSSGLTIGGGSFEFPLIVPGDVPGSIYWDDGLPNHSAIFAFGSGQIVIQGGWDSSIAAGENSYLFIAPASSGVSNALGFQLGKGGHYICSTVAGENAAVFINALGGGTKGINVRNTGPGGDESVNIGNSGTGQISINPRVHMQFAGGLNGMYYYEDFNLAAQTVTATTTAAVTGMTLTDTANDYPTAMNTTTGVWTAPETGPFTFTLYGGFTAWTSGATFGLTILNQTSGRNIANRSVERTTTGVVDDTVTARRWVSAGDQVVFQLTNGTASSRTVATTPPQQSYISIQREL